MEKSGGVIKRGRAQRALCAGVAAGSHTRFHTHTFLNLPPLPPPGEPSIPKLPGVSGGELI